MKKFLRFSSSLILVLGFTLLGHSQVTNFAYTGALQTYVVPAGVTSIQIECFGGDGYGTGGTGGYVSAELPVTPFETLEIHVGGAGTGTTGGYNGGGNSGSNVNYGGGGGASDVRQGGSTLANRIIVAGGGGGTGSNCGTNTAPGGPGGNLTGGNGCTYSCSDCQYTGYGGSQVAGGIAGPTAHSNCGGNNNGVLGVGGSNIGSSGTGGGGGYYGGGSGCYEGAGGGSSYTIPAATNVTHVQGGTIGNGSIVITILCDALTLVPTSSIVCEGTLITLDASSSNGGNITWDNGVTNAVSFAPPVGTTTYTSSSDNGADCGFSIDITVNALPAVVADVDDTLICEGDQITLTGAGASSYIWDNGAANGVAYVPTAGPGAVLFHVTGTDANTCENMDSIEVFISSPIITAVITHENLGSDGAINVTVSGSSGLNDYTWSNGPITEDVSGLTAGTYTLTLDDEACIVDTTFIILNVAGINSNVDSNIKLYPNPTNSAITIEHKGLFQYELYNISGDLILIGNSIDKEIISMEKFADGIYSIIIKSEKGISTIRLVKE